MAAVSARWKLPDELIDLSERERWPDVLTEWSLDYIEVLEIGEDSQTCLCHHHPIREVCHIVNDENGNTSVVGNCCITKFGKEQVAFAGTHKVFDAFKRILADIETSANKELIEYAFTKGAINERDRRFYLEIWRKRSLTGSQERWKIALNRRIIAAIAPSRRLVSVVEQVQTVGERRLQQALEALQRSPTRLADQLLVGDAFDRGYISEKDSAFYNSFFTRHVRYPSLRQQAWINDINHRILRNSK